MAIDGLLINEASYSSAAQVLANGYNDIYVVITSTAATGLNVLTSISSLADFTSKFPTTSDAVNQTIKLIYVNNPAARVSVISGSDSSVVTTGDSKTKADLLYGIGRLMLLSTDTLAFVICPQQSGMTTQADRTALFSALESLAVAKRWISLINTAFDCNTKLQATTERALYSSTRGNSALYYGYGVDTDGKNVPIIGAVAALATLRGVNESIYAPPGGASFPVKGLTAVTGEITSSSDYTDLKTSNVNMTRVFSSTGRVIWLARTLATDPLFLMLNSRMAMSITSVTLERALLPSMFDSVDPLGATRREILRICESVMQQMYLNGALTGDTPDKSYDIREVVAVNNVDSKKIQILVYARFVGTLEMIQVDLTNVDVIPA